MLPNDEKYSGECGVNEAQRMQIIADFNNKKLSLHLSQYRTLLWGFSCLSETREAMHL